MWRWLSDYARAIRALLALCCALGLALMLYEFEQTHQRNRAETVNEVNNTLWAMSELQFESQRLVGAVETYAAGRADLTQLRLRFDILWSRVDVAERESVSLGGTFLPVLADYRRVLQHYDPVVYAPATDTEDLFRMAEDVGALVLHSRDIWTQAFGTQSPADRFAASQEVIDRRKQTEMAAIFLIAVLMIYVLAEVYFANKGMQAEATLRRAAAEASAAKSRFLANVSHEIRTPLNGILGMASELAETPLSTDQAQCLRVIEQSGNVLLGTINDVLDLSRVEAGQLSTEDRPFVLRDLVEAACALYSARAREKQLTLTLQVQENLPPVVVGDETRIRQVLHNLVANAVKFTEAGKVTVRVRADLNGQRLVIAVQDSGPGIEREAQARIFEPFVQADASVTRRHGGSGLGLTISRQLCQAMGGDLSVVSRPGHGATFFCDLPLRTASTEQMRAIRNEPLQIPDLSGVSVLIADDNATNRLILRRFMGATRADLRFAETGEEAVEQCRAAACEVVLMDVQMPVLDGVAATQQLRQLERETGRAPSLIVAVTANVLSHQVDGYVAAGMNEVLGKPVSKRDLMALLARHLDGIKAPDGQAAPTQDRQTQARQAGEGQTRERQTREGRRQTS
ncbi:ATP-binding protein [Maliponia aquimaris]|uniref:histidine kinase n=1 Tax=Maliponia aquimaris TaxID=1673631 RepID=A0A238KVI7_9RHOB|nr:ATP-binding protein [Maliponia aquimaris]SMX46650.1 Autoinducer 2 sensor kinase/phosphatase LuxQ [Maliponia aquimaris]